METHSTSKSQKFQFLEEINIDVNDVLNFSINIDNLKIFLTTLIKNQSTLSQKIIDLENKIKYKQPRKNSINVSDVKKARRSLTLKLSKSKSVTQSSQDDNIQKRMSLNIKGTEELEKFMSSKVNDQPKENGSEALKKNENVNGAEDKDKEESKNGENNNEENVMESIKEETDEKKTETKFQEESENSDISDNNSKIFDIENKINSLEKKVKNLEILNKVSKFTVQGDDKSDDVQLMQIEMTNLKDSNKKLQEENLEIKKQLENINVKLADINIFDLFKDLNLNEGSVDVAKALILNLEKKVFQKIAFMDERDKKLNQDLMELKTKIQDVVNKNGVISHNMDNIKKNFKELGQLLSTNNSETTNMINTLESKTNNMYKELIDKFNEEKNNNDIKIKKINDKLFNIEKLNNENLNPNDLKNNNPEFTEENLAFIEKMANRINEIESKINSILEEMKSYSTKDDIIKIQKDLIKKVNTKEFFELKDKYNLQLAKISNLEDNIQRVQDLNEKNSSDLIFYAKRIEVITSNMISIRTQVEDLIKKEKSKVLDLTKYLEKTTFNKYLKSLEPEKFKLDSNFEELRNLIDDIGNILTKKCNAEDLKAYEDIINTKLEELKLLNTKKFADKIDTNRSMKYLDSQIKHIIDVYIKKTDKSDSWLIAKKPMGGYLCASCESYIGNLKNKESYMPWNKYPQREKDQNYRVGNGFSRMLNMLNIEIKNNDISNEKEIESDEDVKKYFEDNRIKIRIKNSQNNKDINVNSKEKINKNSVSALIKSNSKNNLFQSNSSSKNTNTNILPKLYLNKNEEALTIEPNSPVFNDVGVEKNFNESNIEEASKETKENIESQPHIVKIVKKPKVNINMPESSKTERRYSFIKK